MCLFIFVTICKFFQLGINDDCCRPLYCTWTILYIILLVIDILQRSSAAFLSILHFCSNKLLRNCTDWIRKHAHKRAVLACSLLGTSGTTAFCENIGTPFFFCKAK